MGQYVFHRSLILTESQGFLFNIRIPYYILFMKYTGMHRRFAGLLLWISFLFSCGGNDRVSKEVFDAVNESMEVKKLGDAEITNQALQWGDSISLEAQQELMKNLQQAIADKGTSGAIDFCNAQALSIVSKVSEQHGVTIRRASHRYRNPADKPTELESQFLETYAYDLEQGNPLSPNIQRIKDGEEYLFTKAIVIPGKFCLQCHGEPGLEIDTETLQILDERYPEDKARGHQVGDLRGIWSIQIPKSEVVKTM